MSADAAKREQWFKTLKTAPTWRSVQQVLDDPPADYPPTSRALLLQHSDMLFRAAKLWR